MNAVISRWRTPFRRTPALAVCFLITALLYWPAFSWLIVEHWIQYRNSILGVAPLLLGIYLLRKVLLTIPLNSPSPRVGPVLLMIGGLWMLLGGWVAQASAIMGWSVALVLPGLLWLYAGREGLRQGWFPALCLAMAFPIPGIVEHYLGLYARLWSAALAKGFLGVFGMVLERSGTLLTTGTGIELEVGNACSGVKTMHVFVVSALILLQPLRLQPGRFFKFLPVFFIASILANSVRVAALVLIAEKLGPAWLAGASHELTGLFFFLVTFVPLALFAARWGTKGQAPQTTVATEDSASGVGQSVLVVHAAILSGVFLFAGLTAKHQNTFIHAVPPEVPYLIADWSGRDVMLAPHEIIFYGVSGLRKRSYRRADLETEYVSNTAPVSREGLHEPTGCFTSAGWRLLERREISAEGKMPAVLLRLASGQGQFTQVALFWFDNTKDEVLGSERDLTWRMLRRRITLRSEEVWTLHCVAVPVRNDDWAMAQKTAEELAVELHQRTK